MIYTFRGSSFREGWTSINVPRMYSWQACTLDCWTADSCSGKGKLQLITTMVRALDPGTVGSHGPRECLSFAFMESLCIYGLVIALAILFAK